MVHLESKAIDDALDLLMATELLGARPNGTPTRTRSARHPRLAWGLGEAGRRGEVLFEVNEYGTEITLEQLWEGIER